jgi:hypothetical protein
MKRAGDCWHYPQCDASNELRDHLAVKEISHRTAILLPDTEAYQGAGSDLPSVWRWKGWTEMQVHASRAEGGRSESRSESRRASKRASRWMGRHARRRGSNVVKSSTRRDVSRSQSSCASSVETGTTNGRGESADEVKNKGID